MGFLIMSCLAAVVSFWGTCSVWWRRQLAIHLSSAYLQGVIKGTPASKEYKEGFAASLMVKDLALAQASAEFAGVQAPMTERAKELYERIDDDGLDFGSIFQYVYKGRPEP